MKNPNKLNGIIKWVTRVAALVALAFALPFYFGYGNPLPFIDPSYSAHTNLWLSVFPIVFIGLALGWFYPKVGGLMISGSLLLAFIVTLFIEGDFGWPMLIPLVVSFGFLYTGFLTKKETTAAPVEPQQSL